MPFYHGGGDKNKNGEILCHDCKKSIQQVQNYLVCDKEKCKKVFHSQCAQIHGMHINRVASEAEWICKYCRASDTEPGKRKADSEINASEKNKRHAGLPVDIELKLDNLFSRLDAMNSSQIELKNIMEAVRNDIRDVKNNQNDLSNQINILQEQMESINSEHNELKFNFTSIKQIQDKHYSQISELQSEIENLKQNELANDVIISGLPMDININDTVSKLFTFLKCDTTLKDIREIKTLTRKNEYNMSNKNDKSNSLYKNMSLLVSFKNIEHKENFIKQKKNKKLIYLGELDLIKESEPDRLIYIRNNLTQFKRTLFNNCKQFKSKHKTKFVWLDGNKILMRQNDNTKIYAIHNEFDLKKFEQIINE